VATRAGGIPDKVQDGVNGYLVEPKDVNGLAQAIARLVGDAAGRREFGARSRARVEQLFSWSKDRARDRGALRGVVQGRFMSRPLGSQRAGDTGR